MKISRILLLASLPLTFLATLLMLIAFATAYDPGVSNYFALGNPLPILASVAALLVIACGIAASIVAKRLSEPFSPLPAPSSATFPAALGALGSSVLLFVFKNRFPAKLQTAATVSAILFLLAAVFFLLAALRIAEKHAFSILWAGFAAIIAPIVLNAVYYFDMTVEMNAPVKVLAQMGLLAAMLCVTVEIRALIGRTNPSLTPVLLSFALSLCCLSSLPLIFAAIAGKVFSGAYIAAVPFLLGVGLTAGIRMCGMIFTGKSESPVSEPENTDHESFGGAE